MADLRFGDRLDAIAFLRAVTGGIIAPGLIDPRDSIAFCRFFVNGRFEPIAIGLKVDRPNRPILRIGGPK
jgi:hypothetical protein